MKFEAEIQKNTIDVAKILIFALFWSKNHNKRHNKKALFSQKSQYTPTVILRKEGLHEMGRGWGGGALFVTILWILFSQIPFLLDEEYPYFILKGGKVFAKS